MKKETKADVINTISSIMEKGDYPYYGIRVQTPNPESNTSVTAQIGDVLPNSFDWDDSISTGREIDGTSCINPHSVYDLDIPGALDRADDYLFDGCQLLLVAGNTSYEGDDLRERIIINPVVLAVL